LRPLDNEQLGSVTPSRELETSARKLNFVEIGEIMTEENHSLTKIWPIGIEPTIAMPLPSEMQALVLHRDQYGPPAEVLKCESVPTPTLKPEEADRVLVSIIASGPNFNTNFAALALPISVFGKGDSATIHIPGSDAIGIVVDAGSVVTNVKVGDMVILDSWTDAGTIRGYETHDGFNCQFAVVDEIRAIPVPDALKKESPEILAALMLTYGTAYRAVVERLKVKPGDSILLLGGGKGTSFAGAQIAKALGAHVILVGSNIELMDNLIKRGMADTYINRREIPKEVYGLIETGMDYEIWKERTEPFRQAIYQANGGKPVDCIFEHTGGLNFPLLVSALADGGIISYFGATGTGLKGEYKETFFYDKKRFVLDARWGWMRQKQVLFRNNSAEDIFTEIGLLPGQNGVIWGADDYALEFVKAALSRKSTLAIIASFSEEKEEIEVLKALGLKAFQFVDRDKFDIPLDMPDPLTDEGTPNSQYDREFMSKAKKIGKALWDIFGQKINPDFIVDRPDQNLLHLSTFLVKDFSEKNSMRCGYVIIKGKSNLEVAGSHMYDDSQAREVIKLLTSKELTMEQDDLEICALDKLNEIQQKMLDGTMKKPKGVALGQASRKDRSVSFYETTFLGETIYLADPDKNRFLDIQLLESIGVITIKRVESLNALNTAMLVQIKDIVDEIKSTGCLNNRPVNGLILRAAGAAFVAGADVNEFMNNTAAGVTDIATKNIQVFTDLENLSIPVVVIIDGYALGGGNELAMSAHYRIVTQNAKLGQPEVKLGIIPGYGGMQRLPRLIGPKKACELSVNGEAIDGRTAVSWGLADEFCPSSTGLKRAFEVVSQMAAGAKPWSHRDWDQIASEQKAELTELMEKQVVKNLLSTDQPDIETAKDLRMARAYASKFAIEAMLHGYKMGFEEGLKNDACLFGEITASPSGQEWVSRFIKKDPTQSAFLSLVNFKK
jgi:enoyl-CoA hydratase